ncbi:MAG: hypothetical protein ACRDVM_06740 [Acidimicrobiia bacterium]
MRAGVVAVGFTGSGHAKGLPLLSTRFGFADDPQAHHPDAGVVASAGGLEAE